MITETSGGSAFDGRLRERGDSTRLRYISSTSDNSFALHSGRLFLSCPILSSPRSCLRNKRVSIAGLVGGADVTGLWSRNSPGILDQAEQPRRRTGYWVTAHCWGGIWLINCSYTLAMRQKINVKAATECSLNQSHRTFKVGYSCRRNTLLIDSPYFHLKAPSRSVLSDIITPDNLGQSFLVETKNHPAISFFN